MINGIFRPFIPRSGGAIKGVRAQRIAQRKAHESMGPGRQDLKRADALTVTRGLRALFNFG